MYVTRRIRGVVYTEYASIVKEFTSVKEFLDYVKYLSNAGYNVVDYGYAILSFEH